MTRTGSNWPRPRIPVLRLDWNNPDEVAIHDQVLRRTQDLLDGQVADMPALEAELDGLLERLISAHAVRASYTE